MGSQLSNIKFQVTSVCTATQWVGTTFNVTNDLIENTVITATDASILLSTLDGKSIERMVVTFAAGVATIVARWLTRADALTADANLQKERRVGTIGKIVSFAFDQLDITDTSPKTLAGKYTFTNTNEFTQFKVYNYATEAARDIGIPVPEDGMICYINALEEFQWYKNGVWITWFGGWGWWGWATRYKDSTDDATMTGAIDWNNTTYVLSNASEWVNSCLVMFNWITLERDADYTLVWDTLEFTTAPVTGKIVAIYPDIAIWAVNATTRATSNATSVEWELYRSTNDNNSLYYKDNGWDNIKLIDVTTNKIVW